MTTPPNPKLRPRIYVAACIEEYVRARAAMAVLREHGATITHDWTIEVESHGADDASPTPAERLQYAENDRRGVRTADIVLVLTPEDRRRGCGLWIEFGMAKAYARRIILTGEQRNRSVFCEYGERYDSDAEAVEACFGPAPGDVYAPDMTLSSLVYEAHGNAVEKGFYDSGPKNIGDLLMLVVTELAEAKEEERKPRCSFSDTTFKVDGKPEGFAIEVADAVIRLADLAGYLAIDLEEAVRVKMAYNRTRGHRHGGKSS